PNGNYYLRASDEIIPVQLATPSPDNRFQPWPFYPVANEFDPWGYPLWQARCHVVLRSRIRELRHPRWVFCVGAGGKLITNSATWVCPAAPPSASRRSPPRRAGCERFANAAASRALQSVAVAPYCRFATPVPPHAGQVVTCVSLLRGRFGNKPSGVSSHD